MSLSVADRVTHRLPRPVKCDCCGSPRVHLQKRSLMKMRVPKAWDLVWHCLDCLALVGCHEGTDIPLGYMADAATREARYHVHKVFDRLWRGRKQLSRAEAYIWMAQVLQLKVEDAHIGMLTLEQCEALTRAVEEFNHSKRNSGHWQQKVRKRRRN